MSIKIEPQKLSLYLYQWGPLIYYFNGKCRGINENLVINMNTMSLVYPKLKVFEIDWKKQNLKFSRTKPEDFNKVFLYFDGQKQMEENAPNEIQIKNMFHKCIEFYNLKQERLAKNVGCMGKRKPKYLTDDHINKNTIDYKDLKEIRKRKRVMLNRKLKILNDEEIARIKEEKSHLIIKPQYGLQHIMKKPENINQQNHEILQIANKTSFFKNPDNNQILNIDLNNNMIFISKTHLQQLDKKLLFLNSNIHVNNSENTFVSNDILLPKTNFISSELVMKPLHITECKISNSNNINIEYSSVNKPVEESIDTNIQGNINSKILNGYSDIDHDHNYIKSKEKSYLSQINKIFKNKNNILKTGNSILTIGKDKLESKWFDNVQIGDLPLDIIDETDILDTYLKNN